MAVSSQDQIERELLQTWRAAQPMISGRVRVSLEWHTRHTKRGRHKPAHFMSSVRCRRQPNV
jgi:hypothetical protein